MARFATIAPGRAKWRRSARAIARSRSASGIAGRKNGTGEGDDFTVQQHTADVGRFIAGLDAGPVHLLGHSRGGYIAFRAAQSFPDLIRSLILVEPGGVLAADLETGPAAGPTIALGPLYAKAAERIRRGEIDEGVKFMIDVISGPGGWDRTPEPNRQTLRDNAATLLGQIKEQRAPYARADAEAIRAPTLLIAGERSPASFHHPRWTRKRA